jgi:hypothetical protein
MELFKWYEFDPDKTPYRPGCAVRTKEGGICGSSGVYIVGEVFQPTGMKLDRFHETHIQFSGCGCCADWAQITHIMYLVSDEQLKEIQGA